MTRFAAALLLLAAFLVPAAARAQRDDGPQPLTARVVYADGRPVEEMKVLVSGSDVWLAARDVTAIFSARRTWRADIRRLALRFGDHEMALVVGSEVAFLDGEDPIHLPGPIPYREGRVYLPLSLLLTDAGAPRPFLPEAITWDPAERTIHVGSAPVPGLLQVREESGREDRLDLVVDRPYDYRLVSASRTRFILRIPGAHGDPDSLQLPTGSDRFLALTVSESGNGTAVSFAVPEDVLGYQILRLERPNRISIVLSSDERAIREGRVTPFSGGFETRADLRTIVIDPGRGGSDPGVRSLGGTSEADVTLALARDIAYRLEDRLGITAVLTRDSDRDLTNEQRVDAANVAGADLFLSLHFDGYPSPIVKGPRAVVARPPSGAPPQASGALKDLGFRVWGDAQRGEINSAYLFADRLVGEVALALGLPSRGVEEWPLPILNAAVMPAVYLDLDALTAPEADTWLSDSDKRSAVADAIVTAVDRYRREVP